MIAEPKTDVESTWGEVGLPLVAIVVVNYRSAGQAIDCVRSLQRVLYPNVEIIVVDNDSRDGSAERLANELRGVRVLRAPINGGYAAGNNLGIQSALKLGAEFIHVLNPDTIVINPNYLLRLVEFLRANPRVGVVGPKVCLRSVEQVQNTVLRFPWLGRRITDWIGYRISKPKPRSGDTQIEAEVLNGVCVLFRAECIRQVGSFDERTFAYVEDVEWSYRSTTKGWRHVYLPVDSIVHVQAEHGYHRAGPVDYLLKRNTLYFLLKTGRVFQAAGYSLATLMFAGVYVVNDILHLRSMRNSVRWACQIGRAYRGLWTGRWDDVMGAPQRGTH